MSGRSRGIVVTLVVLAIAALGIAWARWRVPSDAIRRPRRIVAAGTGACALFDDAPMRCWGNVELGTPHGYVSAPYAKLAPIADVRELVFTSIAPRISWRAACLVDASDSVACGSIYAGYENDGYPALHSIGSLHAVHSLTAHGARVCVIARSGDEPRDGVFCHVRTAAKDTKRVVNDPHWDRVDLGAPIAIGVNRDELCAVGDDGRVRCVEHNSGVVREVRGAVDTVQLAMGDDFACARDVRGLVRCWGRNDEGQLGDGTTFSRDDARPVALAGAATDISLFERAACVVRSGEPWCWGLIRPSRELPAVSSLVPMRTENIDGLRSITIAGAATCAVRANDATVWCWGFDANGAVGDGSRLPSPGCHREGYSGSSPERERPSAPNVVRTGEAGNYPRGRVVVWIVAALFVVGPIAVALAAARASLRRGSLAHRHLGHVLVGAGLVAALFVPVAIARTTLSALAAYGSACRAWGCSLRDANAVSATITGVPPLVVLGLLLFFFARLRRIVEFVGDACALVRSARRWVAYGIVPALIATMMFNVRAPIDVEAHQALIYLLRDESLDISGLLWAKSVWTIGWIMLVAVVAGAAPARMRN